MRAGESAYIPHFLTPLTFLSMEIIYEDNHLIAINKPPRLLVQGDITGDRTAAEDVKKYIREKYNKPGAAYLGIIHRLDRPASGVCVFARTSKALERMNKLFAEREVKKKYWVITSDRPQPLEGHLTHYILKARDKNVVKAFDTMSNRAKGGKKADLDYRHIGEIGRNFLVEIDLQTGRPHQIRAQMSKIGYPIKGDVKYGHPEKNETGAIYLHCRSLSFIHPVKKERITIVADPPKEQVWNLFGFAKDEG